MKTLKNVLAALAVVIAVGGAFASNNMVLVTGWAINPNTGVCESRNDLPANCSVINPHAVCQIKFTAGTADAYDTQPHCSGQTAGILRKP